MIRPLLSSMAGKIFTYALLFCVPGAFFLAGIFAVVIGAKDPGARYGGFVFGTILLIPFGLIALLGAYTRRSFAKALDADGVEMPFGNKFLWTKLQYVDHVTKHVRVGRVSRQVKDNQLELIFEGGKAIIPPLIHERAAVWDLMNGMPAQVRDDGVPRAKPDQNPIRTEDDLMGYLQSMNKPRDAAD